MGLKSKKTLLSLRLCETIFILLLSSVAFAQQDTTYTPITDTTRGVRDTTAVKGAIDAIVEYTAKDSAVFDIKNQTLYLYNDADLKHKEFELKAARIILYKETSLMEAHGIPDTSHEGKFIGTPIFIEGDKKYEASIVKYNFKTRTGNITMGTTEIEGGYYLGEKIKKVAEDVYFIKNGSYTTCDKAEPDYYFGSPKMKIMRGDKVVAEPVYLYIDGVPIFWIPLGIFPNHSGRSSGLIPPAYGEDAALGRYLSHLGYFWAINDYLDLTFQGNYFTKGRIDLSGRFRYALRYKFSGSLELGGSRIRIGEENDLDKQFSDEWHIGIDHNQNFNPTTSISANVNMYSSKTYLNNSSNNLNQLLLQNAVSNVTLTKSWEGSPDVLTVNYYRDQNLQTGEINQRVPLINFSRSQSFPFRSRNTSLLDLKWYELISYSYSAALENDTKKTLAADSVNFTKDTRGGVKHTIQISAPIKFAYLNLSPNINYYEVWNDKYVEKGFNPLDSSVTTNDKSGIKTFRYFNLGASLNTRLIGILNTSIFGVRGFRHTLTPSISYTYQPDFRKPFWHIYNSYVDASGKQVLYNQFEKEPFGSAPGAESQNISFGLGNVFEMKVKETDTTENKYQLLNLDAGINYNLAADSLKLSELGINYRTQIASVLNIGGSATFNFYKYVDGVGRINRFLWSTDKRIADLTSFNINMSTSIKSSEEEAVDTTKGKKTDEDQYEGIYNDKPPNFKIPWAITLNYNYGISKANPSVLTKSSNISGSLSFSLTRKWKFSFSTGYDIFQQQLTAPYVTIYRDLHCWEMNFSWIPLGEFRGFKFEIRVKAPQLQDIKVTKQTNYRGVYQ